jgi:hypothetical protein
VIRRYGPAISQHRKGRLNPTTGLGVERHAIAEILMRQAGFLGDTGGCNEVSHAVRLDPPQANKSVSRHLSKQQVGQA